MTLRFGTDGVRGVANRELTPELVTALGRAAVRVLGADEPFVVGRDTRRSGPMLEAALVAGLCAEGADVVLVGVLPTPGVAHVARERGAPAAVISASHNPFADNGIKLFAAGGRKIPESLELRGGAGAPRRSAVSQPEPGPEGVGVGVSSEHRSALDDYVATLVDALQGRQLTGLHVVVDCGNGAAFRAAPTALRALGATVDVIHASPDGVNINAGCGSTHPGDLQEAVLVARADAGLAFDGDADRVIAVDERGALVDGDEILAITAIDLHDRKLLRGDAVVATVMSNLGLRRALEPYGVAVVETPVGDRNVLDVLEQRNLTPRRRAVGARDLRRPRHHRRRHPHRHLAPRHHGPARAVALRAGRGAHPGAAGPAQRRGRRRRPAPRATPRSGAGCATSTTSSATTAGCSCGPRAPSRWCG